MEEWERRNIRKIKELKNKHKGERCFILGNDPSLDNIDFSLLQDEILFGVNALFERTEEFGINPQYWAITNKDNWRSYGSTLQKLDTKLFVGGIAMQELLKESSPQVNTYLIPQLGLMWMDTSNFSTDLSKGAYNGDYIIIDICLQAAYYMGFSEVYLIGLDAKLNLAHSLPSYGICKKYYEADNRKIINAGIGGKLTMFPKKVLKDIVQIKKHKIRREQNVKREYKINRGF